PHFPELATLPLPDALPISVRDPRFPRPPTVPVAPGPDSSRGVLAGFARHAAQKRLDRAKVRRGHALHHLRLPQPRLLLRKHQEEDRKSTRLNSSHVKISYA